MAKFEHATILEAFDHAVRNSKTLRVRDAATVAAARKLADMLDEHDKLAGTIAPTFLKYLEALNLVEPAEATKPGRAAAPTKPQDEVAKMRAKLRSS